MLQETHLTKNDIDQWKTDWQGDIIFSGSQLNSEGICILFNPKYKIKVENVRELVTGRIITCEALIENNRFTLINVYRPSKGSDHIFELLNYYVLTNDEHNFIIGGDFNTTLNCTLDKKNGRPDTNKKCRNKIIQLMQNNDIIDIWRELHGNKMQFTWHSNTKPIIHSNIVRNIIKSCTIQMDLKLIIPLFNLK